MNELSQFLDQQRQAGAVESVGSFTVALEKARDKMGAHSLVSPEDYLLKLVQCATVLKVEELRIKLERRTVMVFFETPLEDRTVSVEAVQNAMLAPLEEQNPARSHLALAICALINQDPAELMWGEWDQGCGTILTLGTGRSELFRNAPFPRQEPLADARRFFLFFFSKQPGGELGSQTKREKEAVLERCCFAPMPIYLQGEMVGPGLPLYFSNSDPAAALTAPYIGSFRLNRDNENPLCWHGQPETKIPTMTPRLSHFSRRLPPVLDYRIPRDFPVPLNETVHFRSVYAVPIYLFGAAHLHYVKDGVCLSPVRVHDAGGGALAVLPGDHLKTDLTGFQVIENESVEEDKAIATEIWTEMVEQLTPQDLPTFSSESRVAREGAVASVFGCCLFFPVGLLVGPLYTWFMSQGTARFSNSNPKLSRQLENRRGYLAYFKESPLEENPG